MMMKFGKYRGNEISEIPDSYLQWLSANVELREPLASYVWEELQERGLEVDQRPTTGGLDHDRVKSAYRELSLQFHPDRPGGTKEAMQAINLFYEKLTGRK